MKWSNSIANNLQWNSEISNIEQKKIVADKIAERVRNGDVIGVGSGSTAFLSLQAISKKVKENKLSVITIPTSYEVALTCSILGLPTATLMSLKPDWYFDGADEVDPNSNLIKGRGGAMYAEKLVLRSSPENYILVDESKLVKKLGSKFPIPVEVDPRAVHLVETELLSFGASEVKLRLAKSKDGPVITEMGNFILDVRYPRIEKEMEKEIKQITGVIESGLFIGYNVKIITN